MEILLYNVKVSICLIAFYLIYRLLLSRETFVRLNRIVLLLMVVLSFVLPRCGVTWQSASENVVSGMSITVMLDEISVGVGGTEVVEGGMSWWSWLTVLYWTGLVMFAVRLLVTMVKIAVMTRKGERIVLENGVRLLLCETGKSPFSWMWHVWMSRSDYEESGREILTHELAHIRYGHSVDLMAMDVACCLLWFNPAMWLMRMELCAVHEYEADKAVLDSGIDARQYHILLIKKAAGSKWSSVANSFNHSKLKGRITMMLRKESSAWARAKVLYALPIIGGAMIAFANVACSESEDSEKVSYVKMLETDDYDLFVEQMKSGIIVVEKIEPWTDECGEEKWAYTMDNGEKVVYGRGQRKDNVFMVVEQMPEYPGGNEALMKYICENVKYPKAAADKNIQGKVFVNFVVDDKGDVTQVFPANDVDPILNAEAVRVVSAMPRWEPGRQRGIPVNVGYTIPINFVLE